MERVENPLTESQVGPFELTDGRTVMTNLIVAFHNRFVHAPNNTVYISMNQIATQRSIVMCIRV